MLRRLVFSSLCLASFLGAVELGAAAWERAHLRGVPLPSPSSRREDFLERAERLRGAGDGLAVVEAAAGGLALAPEAKLAGEVGYRTNTLGLRGTEVGPKRAGVTRIVTLGDSCTFGDGVAEGSTYSALLGPMLEAGGVRPVEVVNAGVPGQQARGAAALLGGARGEALAADVVIASPFWNDVGRAIDGYQPESIDTTRLRAFAAYRVGVTLLSPALATRKIRWIDDEADMEALRRAPIQDQLLADYALSLEAIAVTAARRRARLVLLSLPSPVDLDPAGPPLVLQRFRAALRAAAEEHDAPFVDAAACFRERGATLAFFRDQVHPSTWGHALLARCIADELTGGERSALGAPRIMD